MSPLRIDLYNADLADWVYVGELNPNDRLGSISQNKPDGEREIYLFGCQGEQSVICKSIKGADAESPTGRTIFSEGFETVATLTEGQGYELSVKTDRSESRSLIRFTHTKEGA